MNKDTQPVLQFLAHLLPSPTLSSSLVTVWTSLVHTAIRQPSFAQQPLPQPLPPTGSGLFIGISPLGSIEEEPIEHGAVTAPGANAHMHPLITQLLLPPIWSERAGDAWSSSCSQEG